MGLEADRQRDKHGVNRRQARLARLRCRQGRLEFFSRAWAGELVITGNTVKSVAPGLTETKSSGNANPPGFTSSARHLAGIPIGRFRQPHELAAAICFLLSEEAGFMRVDGGGSLGTGTGAA